MGYQAPYEVRSHNHSTDIDLQLVYSQLKSGRNLEDVKQAFLVDLGGYIEHLYKGDRHYDACHATEILSGQLAYLLEAYEMKGEIDRGMLNDKQTIIE